MLKIRHYNKYNLQSKNYSVQEITLNIFSLKLPNFWLRFLFPLVWWKTASLWRFRGHSRTKLVGAWVSVSGLAALSATSLPHGGLRSLAWSCMWRVYPSSPPTEVCCQHVRTTKNHSDLPVPLSPLLPLLSFWAESAPWEKKKEENTNYCLEMSSTVHICLICKDFPNTLA